MIEIVAHSAAAVSASVVQWFSASTPSHCLGARVHHIFTGLLHRYSSSMEGATISRDDEGRNSLLYLCCRCIFSYGVSVSSGVNNNGASLLHLACAANSGGKFFIDILLSTCKDDPPTVSNCFNCEDRHHCTTHA